MEKGYGMTWTVPAVLCAFALAACGIMAASAPAEAATEKEAVEMHRLYNPNSGEHFYTASAGEKNHLVSLGWIYEGTGWMAPSEGDPVYRLYNPNAGDHHYTLSGGEKDHLVSVGWRYEGIGWKSNADETVPLYRQYNPNAAAGAHNYTTSKGENDMLVSAGWNAEGIAWYGCELVGEVGHWETVVLEAAYDEPVYETRYRNVCNHCGEVLTKDTAGPHSEKHALAGEGSGWHIAPVEELVDTIHHDAVTEQRWIVDVQGHWE